MTREQMCKYKFRAYMSIDFNHSQLAEPTACMLVSINYDTEIMILRPLPTDNPYEQNEFPAHISHCELSRPTLKIL